MMSETDHKTQLIKDLYHDREKSLVQPRSRKFFMVTLLLSVGLGLFAGYVGSLWTKPYFIEEAAVGDTQFNLVKNLINERFGRIPFDDYSPNKSVKAADFNEIEKRIYYAADLVGASLVDIYSDKAVVSSSDALDYNYLAGDRLGAGFVLTSDGWIMTTREAVNNQKKLLVSAFDGSTYPVSTVVYDQATAVAFVKISAKNLPVVDFGDSEELIPGGTVLNLNKLNGLVVNNIRSLDYSLADNKKQLVHSSEQFFKYFLLSDELSGEYNGSPVVNLDGQVMGMVVSLGSESAKFAIPANQFRVIIEDVLKTGTINRPYFGVSYLDMSTLTIPAEYLANNLNLLTSTAHRGALIYKNSNFNGKGVIKNSPADRAKLLPGDLIIEVNNEKVDADNSLTDLIMEYRAKEKLELKIIRQGKSETVTVELE